MLEILALIFLTRQIGTMAQDKGLKPGKWKLYTVLSWFAGEIAGAILGVLIFGPSNFVSIFLVAIGGAITGFLFIKSTLSKQPDQDPDDIDQIGNN